ncbi:MAG: FAD-binding oxidoreductase [Ilumatobacteraceae bacterium]
MSVTTTSLPASLVDIVGPDHVLDDPDITDSYATDWTGRYRGEASLVVRPADTAQVAAVLRVCADAGAEVVPQGGNTGLVGGGVPRQRPMVVLSTRRLDELGPVDAGALQVTAGAGVTLARWRDHARAAGLDAPLDFASRDSATIGGAIATNAGGSRVVRFGTMRAQVAGITAVLADGSAVGSLAGLPKETVGIHWPSLIAGSEGTLAVVTAARLRLVPWYRRTATAMITTATLDDAVVVLAALRADVRTLDAVELILPEAMAVVAAHLGATPPVGGDGSGVGAYVVVECADHTDPTDELLTALADRPEILDAAVTTEGPARDRLVAFRDRITESISALGVPLKLDVAVPVGALEALMLTVRRSVGEHGGRMVPFGHLAEGNVHVNILDAGDREAITAEVLTAAAGLGGTISAEHGVGIAKGPWLHLVRTPAELTAAAAVKHALDPAGILNPGVLSPDPT